MSTKKRIDPRGLPALGLTLILAAALAAVATPATAERLVVPLSSPGQPATLHASGMNTAFTVEAYDGQEVIIEAEPRDGEEGGRDEKEAPPPGMRRLPNASFGLTAEEENNVVEVELEGFAAQRVTIRVPRATSVHVATVNGGELLVQGVAGEHELENVNGGITARDVAGALVAHTTNGTVKVTLARIDAGKPMSFVSFNGNVDVTFPANLAADLKLRSDNGEIFTDFDVELAENKPVKNEERKGGAYRVSLERAMEAKVGGGGPEMTLRTFNGSIYLRKGR